MITNHTHLDHCQICGKVEPTASVYVPQADETMKLCEECQPQEAQR